MFAAFEKKKQLAESAKRDNPGAVFLNKIIHSASSEEIDISMLESTREYLSRYALSLLFATNQTMIYRMFNFIFDHSPYGVSDKPL